VLVETTACKVGAFLRYKVDIPLMKNNTDRKHLIIPSTVNNNWLPLSRRLCFCLYVLVCLFVSSVLQKVVDEFWWNSCGQVGRMTSNTHRILISDPDHNVDSGNFNRNFYQLWDRGNSVNEF